MKLMNSLTHSCMHSFASFAILAFSGSEVFMIRATGAKLRMLASDAPLDNLGVDCGGDKEECGEWEGMTVRYGLQGLQNRGGSWGRLATGAERKTNSRP